MVICLNLSILSVVFDKVVPSRLSYTLLYPRRSVLNFAPRLCVVFPLPDNSDYLKVSQYADDMTVVVGRDEYFEVLDQCLKRYKHGSGAKLNMSKSEGLFLGAWRSRQDTPLSLTRHNDQLRLLGIVVGRGPNVVKFNWQLAVDKMGAEWKGRDLSLVGRAVVAQSLTASTLWYVAQLVVPPWNVVDAAKSDLAMEVHLGGSRSAGQSHDVQSPRPRRRAWRNYITHEDGGIPITVDLSSSRRAVRVGGSLLPYFGSI